MRLLTKSAIVTALSLTAIATSAAYAAGYNYSNDSYVSYGNGRGYNADCPYRDGSGAYFHHNRGHRSHHMRYYNRNNY